MSVVKSNFGKTKDGKTATLYTIENKNGMRVSFCDYGAAIVHIVVPDRNGKLEDIALGYDNVTGYEENGSGYGSFIGRHANRIGGAAFSIDGTTYELAKNDNAVNNLHSGPVSYNKYFYEVEVFTDDPECTSISFSRLSPDGEQGFPGNLDVTVTYTLTDDNDLAIEYYAVSDKKTVINLTNHSYFNLSGQASGSIEDHKVWLKANRFTPTDDKLIPTGELRDVTGTPMDFRIEKTVGQDINSDYEPIVLAGGFDHNYELDLDIQEEGELDLVASLYDEKSGRFMEVYTDCPGMQLYTGNFINGAEDPAKGKGGVVYKKRDGICFETQFFPNSCNEPAFKAMSDCVFEEGEAYDFCTVYSFSTK